MRAGRTLVAGFVAVMVLVACMPGTPRAGDEPDGTEAGGIAPQRYDPTRDLVARRTATPIVIDGVVDAAWDGALKLDGYVTGASDNMLVDMKALFDDDYVYLLVTWNETFLLGTDPNYYREPWELLSNGSTSSWERKEWGEDRIAFMWELPGVPVPAFSSQGCNGICHHELEMYTENAGEWLDAWLWDAATTDVNGYADDGFLGNNNSVDFDPLRMHVTVSDIDWDPGDDGWWVNTDLSAPTGSPRPAYIWRDAITPANASFLLESEARQVDWATFDNATLPVGYMVPGTLIKTPSGDRADVSAKGRWEGKGWTVELKRARSTGSPRDVDFSATNVAYNFSVAITNNLTGENHSEAADIFTMWLAEPDMPDLRPWNIALVNEPYVVDEPVVVNVFVENIGWQDAPASTVALYWDEQATPVGYVDVGPIPWGGSVGMSDVVWDTAGLAAGTHTMRAVADPNGTVAEIYDTNNVYTKQVVLYPELLPDLVIGNITVSGPGVNGTDVPRGDHAVVHVTVGNPGTLAAAGVVVEARVQGSGALVGNGTVDLPAGGSAVVDIPWTVALAEGPHALVATVDPGDAVRESDETNNTATLDIEVTPPVGPDLVVVSVTPETGTVRQDQDTYVNVTVRNEGTLECPAGLSVGVYLDEAVTQGDYHQIGAAVSTGPIPPQGEWEAQVEWSVPFDAAVGTHSLRAHVNWDRAIEELDEADNNATYEGLEVLRRAMPDLVVGSIDPALPEAKLGTTVLINVTVGNVGERASQTTTVEVLDLDRGGTLWDAILPEVPAGGTVTLAFEWAVAGVPAGILNISFAVDPSGLLEEADESNNALAATLAVLPADVPDLAVVGVTVLPTAPRVGESLTITVEVANGGTEASVATTVDVMVGAVRVGQAAVAALAVGAGSTVQVAWPATEVDAPGPLELRVVVDPTNVNGETSRGDNVLTVGVTFLRAPAPALEDLTITSSAARVADGGQVTLTVHLANSGDEAATVRLVLRDGPSEAGSRQAVIVPANGSREERFTVSLSGEGDHVLAVTVYRGTDVAQDPTGKDLVSSVVVTVEAAGGDGGGSGAALAMAAAIAVVLVLAVALVLLRRRRPPVAAAA